MERETLEQAQIIISGATSEKNAQQVSKIFFGKATWLDIMQLPKKSFICRVHNNVFRMNAFEIDEKYDNGNKQIIWENSVKKYYTKNTTGDRDKDVKIEFILKQKKNIVP
ncbi:MAG: hypothetical protein ABIA63_10255 [bacterium]